MRRLKLNDLIIVKVFKSIYKYFRANLTMNSLILICLLVLFGILFQEEIINLLTLVISIIIFLILIFVFGGKLGLFKGGKD